MSRTINANRYWVLSGGLLAALSAPAQAQQWQFQPRVEAGFMYYEFEQDAITVTANQTEQGVDDNGIVVVAEALSATSVESVSFNDTLPFIGVGGSVFYQRFFVDLYARVAFSGNDSVSPNQTLNDNTTTTATAPDGSSSVFAINSDTLVSSQTNIDFDREDYAIAIGYAFSDRFVVYGGYKIGRTRLEQREVATAFNITDASITTLAPDGSVIPEFTASSSGRVTLRGSGETDSDFKQRGPFIGATYGIPFGDTGTFTANLGVAFLNGELDQSVIIDKFEILETSLDEIDDSLFDNIARSSRTQLDGDVIGLTLGLSWRGALTERLSYTVGVSGYQYNFESNQDNSPDFSETTFNTSVGLVYLF